MGLLEKIGREVGAAIKAYQIAKAPARRPKFLSSVANAGKWLGGDMGMREAAQKRAIQNSWIYTAINFKAREFSAGKMHVYPKGVGDDSKYFPGHPFEQILSHPNPYMGGAFFEQYSFWWLDMDGNSFTFCAPDEYGNLAELWPLPSHQVRVVPGDNERFIDYYEFMPEGVVYRIPAEYVSHVRYPNPFDIFRGLAPLVAAILPSDADSAMAYWNGKFFGDDNVMPSAIISLGSGDPSRPIDPSDLDELKNDLAENYGASNRKTAITNAQTMYAQLLGWNAKDMDFMAGRKFSKEEIYEIFGIPLGVTSVSATEASATVADNVFKEKTLWPTMILVAEERTNSILRRWYGENIECRFEDIRPIINQMAIQEATATMTDLTIDERRARYWGLGPLPDGKGKTLPNQFPTSETGSGLVQPTGDLPGHGSEYVEQTAGLPRPQNALVDDAKQDLRNWRTKSLKSVKSGDLADVSFVSEKINADLQELIRSGLEIAGSSDEVKAVFEFATKGIMRSWRPWSLFEDELKKILLELLLKQGERLLNEARENGAAGLEDPEFWVEERAVMLAEIGPTLTNLATQAVEKVRETVGQSVIDVDWNLANDLARQEALDYAGQMIGGIEETTVNAVKRELSQWTASSETMDDLTKRIAAIKDDAGQAIFSAQRAETIAVTEATNVYASANTGAWEKAGYARAVFKPAAHVRCRCYVQPWRMPDGSKVIVWYTARDERVCTRPIETPMGTVAGCKALHRVVISDGPYLGQVIAR
jgi:HK97 family phage portal protein